MDFNLENKKYFNNTKKAYFIKLKLNTLEGDKIENINLMSIYNMRRSWMCKFCFFTFFAPLLPQIPMDTVYSKCVSLLLLLLVNVGCGISEMFVLSGVADIQRFIVNYCKNKRLSVLYV